MRNLAVLTSGGDAAGMNACVRAVMKYAMYRGCKSYIIREGWEGLVRGNDEKAVVSQIVETALESQDQLRFLPTIGEGELIREGESETGLRGRYIIPVRWNDMRGFLHVGGTLIGTQRCEAFRSVEGRRKAALNLIKHGIDALVVIGGDGSLTGADILRSEWPQHVEALLDAGAITREQAKTNRHLNIVGVVGSIDNDLANTSYTIGAFTALQRICESVDSIETTASSHSRAFVIEVMGRHCGWLALMSALATNADYVFVPERPPHAEDWREELVDEIRKHKLAGKRKCIVIVAEGAIDKHLNDISAAEVKDVLTQRLNLDSRVTTLGHNQRGGSPVALDRIIATLQGVEAVDTVLEANVETPSYIIGIQEFTIKRIKMMDTVAATKQVAKEVQAKNFDGAVKLRSAEFSESLRVFRAVNHITDDFKIEDASKRLRIGIVHVGAPAGGVNAATRTAVRYALSRGHEPIGIYNGFTGLAQGNLTPLSFLRVENWGVRGGSELGTNRSLPDKSNFDAIAAQLTLHKIDALLIIGGFEALTALAALEDARDTYSVFKMNMVHIPATLSNNVPETYWSLGADTSLNALMNSCDVVKQSASSSRNRVFVVETQGGQCGYLALVGSLACGASICYTPEDGVTLSQLHDDIEFLRMRYDNDVKGRSEGRLVVQSEKASHVLTTQTVSDILSVEGKPLFDSRYALLGHTLQGGVPSPRDRILANRLAVRALDFLEDPSAHGAASNAATIVITETDIRFFSCESMFRAADIQNRRGYRPWWGSLSSLIGIMAGRWNVDDCEGGKSEPMPWQDF